MSTLYTQNKKLFIYTSTFLKSRFVAQKSGHVSRKEFIRKHTCNSCDQWATKLIESQVGDSDQKATRIERYCQKHFELIIK